MAHPTAAGVLNEKERLTKGKCSHLSTLDLRYFIRLKYMFYLLCVLDQLSKAINQTSTEINYHQKNRSPKCNSINPGSDSHEENYDRAYNS